jgi:hypothetical protein
MIDEEVKKVGSTFSRPLKRFYSEENADLLIKELVEKELVSIYSIFSSKMSSYRSKFYLLKDIEEQNKWIPITNSLEIDTAKKIIKKINDRKLKKDKQSLNLSGFDFTGVLQALKGYKGDNYDYLLKDLDDNGIEALFRQKVIRSNGSYYNLIGNLKKEIRLNLKHNTSDVVELDIEAAFPSILPIYLNNFLFGFDQQFSRKIDRINLTQKDIYKIKEDKLKQEFVQYKTKSIYTILQNYLEDTYELKIDRKDIKSTFLIFLFADPKEHSRKPKLSILVKKSFKTLFPEIYKALLIIKNYIHYNQLAISIQTMISKMIKDTMKKVFKENKDCPIIPIYDCFITTTDNQELVTRCFRKVLDDNELTHIDIKPKVLFVKDPTDTSFLGNSDYNNNKINDNQFMVSPTLLVDTFSLQVDHYMQKRGCTFKGRDKRMFEVLLKHFLSENLRN